jgi:hypothetical protein
MENLPQTKPDVRVCVFPCLCGQREVRTLDVGKGCPQELNDSRHVSDGGNGWLVFPVRNRDFVNADAVGYLLLQELEVQPPHSDMIA